MPLQNVGPIEINYGDIIRDDDTGIDFVVDSLALGAGGAGVVYGISLLDRKLREWAIQTYSDAPITIVRKNYEGKNHKEVLRQVEQVFKDASYSVNITDRDAFLTKLASDEGKVLRGLLMIGADQTGSYSPQMQQLGNAIKGVSGKNWTANQILEAIVPGLPDGGYDPLFLEMFAEDLSQAIKKSQVTSGTAATGGQTPRLLQELIFSRGGQPSPVFSIFSALESSGKNAQIPRDLAKFLKGSVIELGGREGQYALGEHPLLKNVFDAANPEERLASLYRNLVYMQGGLAPLPDSPSTAFFKKYAAQDIGILAKGKSKGRFSPLMHMLLQDAGTDRFRLSEYIESIDADTIKTINRQRPRRSQSDRYSVRLGSHDIDIKQVSANKLYSIELSTFFNNTLAGKELEIGSPAAGLASEVLSMSDMTDVTKAMELARKSGITDHIILEGTQLRAALAADRVHLTDLFQMHGEIAESVKSSLPSIRQAHRLAYGSLLDRSNPYIEFSAQKFADPVPIFGSPMTKDFTQLESPSRLFAYKKKGAEYIYSRSLNTLVEQVAQHDANATYNEILAYNLPDENITQQSFYDDKILAQRPQNVAELMGAPGRTVADTTSMRPLANNIEDAFKRGQNSVRASLFVSEMEGVKARMVTTSLDAPGGVNDVLARSRNLMNGNPDQSILFMDIETDRATGKIKGISIVDMEVLKEMKRIHQGGAATFAESIPLNEHERLLKGTSALSDALQRVNRRTGFENRFKLDGVTLGQLEEIVVQLERADGVAAQFSADFYILENAAEMLASDGNPDNKAAAQNLKKRIQAVKRNKGISLETIHMVAGTATVGNASQNILTRKFFHTKELHHQLMDVFESYALIDEPAVRTGFNSAVNGSFSKLNAHEISPENPVYVRVNNRTSKEFDGKLVKILSIEDAYNPYEQAQTLIKSPHIRVRYQLPNGVVREVAMPQNFLASLFDGSSEVYTGQMGEQMFQSKDALQVTEEAIVGRADRMMRELSSTTRYVGSVGSRFNASHVSAQEALSTRVARARYIATQISPSINEELLAGGAITEEALAKQLQKIAGDTATDFRQFAGRFDISLKGLNDDTVFSVRGDVLSMLETFLTDPAEAIAAERVFNSPVVREMIGSTLTENRTTVDAAFNHLLSQSTTQQRVANNTHLTFGFDDPEPLGLLFGDDNPGYAQKLSAAKTLRAGDEIGTRRVMDAFIARVGHYAAQEESTPTAMLARAILGRSIQIEQDGQRSVLQLSTLDDQSTRELEALYKTLPENKLFQEAVMTSDSFLYGNEELLGKAMRSYTGLADTMTYGLRAKISQLETSDLKEELLLRTRLLHEEIISAQQSAEVSDKHFLGHVSNIMDNHMTDFLSEGGTTVEDRQTRLDTLKLTYETPSIENLENLELGKRVMGDYEDFLLRMSDASPEEAQKVFDRLREKGFDLSGAQAKAGPTRARKIVDELGSIFGLDEIQDLQTAFNLSSGIDNVEVAHRLVTKTSGVRMPSNVVESAHTAVTESLSAKFMSGLGDMTMGAIGAAAILPLVAGPVDLTSSTYAERPDMGSGADYQRYSKLSGGSSHFGPAFTGDTTHFKLDISVSAFSKNNQEAQRLISSLYNGLTGSVNHLAATNNIVDQRDSNVSQAAIEAFR